VHYVIKTGRVLWRPGETNLAPLRVYEAALNYPSFIPDRVRTFHGGYFDWIGVLKRRVNLPKTNSIWERRSEEGQ
jgi:hypothetical protein